MNAFSRPQKLDAAPRPGDDMPSYDARDLIADGVQARVVLDGQSYFLRITRAGKLILTK
ncbi:hemin uptake protein HemP [Litoreibacter roseus]|uniref:Hemin uptake protein HemP n=1 Tax=Litoreibacter roseus TaxID=2601869 RepID=A0A6N6JLD7_9RHOB|nr:hemin uptake protein HemP [Litoreibacter roseus]GFE66229.1 hemin uptake protein HemP [Litoreibacter roseus]